MMRVHGGEMECEGMSMDGGEGRRGEGRGGEGPSMKRNECSNISQIAIPTEEIIE